jgi:hypothetical protein
VNTVMNLRVPGNFLTSWVIQLLVLSCGFTDE